MSEAQGNPVNDPCHLTLAVGSTALGKTFCSIVVSNGRAWPWTTGVTLLPGPSSEFVLEADGPQLGHGVSRLDWVELVGRDSPGSLLHVEHPQPQQLDAPTRVCAENFRLTVNEGWNDEPTGECWLQLPGEATASGGQSILNERAELLVSTYDMGRAWLHVAVTSGRGRLRDC